MKGRVTTIFVLHGVSVLIVLGLAASQENKLFAEIRDRVSNYASFVSSRSQYFIMIIRRLDLYRTF